MTFPWLAHRHIRFRNNNPSIRLQYLHDRAIALPRPIHRPFHKAPASCRSFEIERFFDSNRETVEKGVGRDRVGEEGGVKGGGLLDCFFKEED